MEIYKKTTEYDDVFSANMTMDTNAEEYSGVLHLVCKSCQQCRHQCYGCRTGFTGERLEDFLSPSDVEKVLESLLEAA